MSNSNMNSYSCTSVNQALTSSPRPGSSKCILISIPAEIRQMILKELFSSTRLTFGYRQINYMFRKVLPTRNALAILRVCRQINQEADVLWMSRVLFNFEDGMSLLDKVCCIKCHSLDSSMMLTTTTTALIPTRNYLGSHSPHPHQNDE